VDTFDEIAAKGLQAAGFWLLEVRDSVMFVVAGYKISYKAVSFELRAVRGKVATGRVRYICDSQFYFRFGSRNIYLTQINSSQRPAARGYLSYSSSNTGSRNIYLTQIKPAARGQ
jgi:hypothetical protein